MKIFGWTMQRTSSLVQLDEARSEAEYLNTFRAVMREAHELATSIPDATAVLKPEICHTISNRERVVWRIPRPKGDYVFMRADRYPNEDVNTDRWLVYVSAQQFYFWWRWSAEANPSKLNLPESNKNRPPIFSKIEDDYKYSLQYHWKEGVENPTVLPKVHWDSENGIDFTDGMTRTMWLVRNGIAAFPVETTEAEASGLHALAGYVELKPRRLMDLWAQE